MTTRGSRIRARGASTGVVLAILALAVPSLVAAAPVTVSAIPGGGWIQSPDNAAGLSAAIVANPAAGGQGTSSVKLATTTATTQAVGIARPLVSPLSDLTSGSWMTYATGTSGNLVSEPAGLRFALFRDGIADFTSLVFERVYNATVTANVWQTTTFDGGATVWQTSNSEAFCTSTLFCTLNEFKAHYPNANIAGLTVAIGSGIPVTTSFVDAVSVTETSANEVVTTDTWNFELAAVSPTPPRATAPPTDLAAAATDPGSFDARPFIVLGLVSLIALLSVSMRRTRPTH